MNHQLEKLSNQARFVQMIIEGKLVVSKKRKRDLVAELKEKDFKPFQKVVDATKDGELEPAMEDEDEDKELDSAANAYDYLLGMAIWSLTKERYEKLLRQIGDKQDEIDDLIKKSKEDLWNRDLDEFMAEWTFQLEDEKQRRKKVQGMKRRVSSKLRTQTAPSRKRKNDSDDEAFDVKPKKGKKAPEPKGLLTSYLSKAAEPPKPAKVEKPKPKPAPVVKDEVMALDGAADSDSDAFLDIGKIASKQRQESEEAIRPAASRGARAVRKPVKYGGDTSDESQFMSDGGFDVSKMVKGIGASATNGAAGTSRPLFAATTTLSRPGSSAGLAATRKSYGRDRTAFDDDNSADETDYMRLAPPSANGAKQPATAKSIKISDDEDDAKDDSMDIDPPVPAPVVSVGTTVAQKKRGGPAAATTKPKAATAKGGAKSTAAAPKAKTKETAKPAALAKASKQLTLSPAAKAYAAKQAKGTSAAPPPTFGLKNGKGRMVLDDDDDSDAEQIANDMLSDDNDEDEVVVSAAGRGKATAAAAEPARPSRRAAAQSRKAWVVESDEDEEVDDVEEDTADFDDEESD